MMSLILYMTHTIHPPDVIRLLENLEVYKDMLKKQFSMKLASTQLIANPDEG